MSDLRAKLIRLASEKPELRKDLLPLLRQGMRRSRYFEFKLTPDGAKILKRIHTKAKELGFSVPDSLRYQDITKYQGSLGSVLGQHGVYSINAEYDPFIPYSDEEEFGWAARREYKAERAKLGLSLVDYNNLLKDRYETSVSTKLQEKSKIVHLFPTNLGKPRVDFYNNGMAIEISFPLNELVEQA